MRPHGKGAGAPGPTRPGHEAFSKAHFPRQSSMQTPARVTPSPRSPSGLLTRVRPVSSLVTHLGHAVPCLIVGFSESPTSRVTKTQLWRSLAPPGITIGSARNRFSTQRGGGVTPSQTTQRRKEFLSLALYGSRLFLRLLCLYLSAFCAGAV